MPTRRACRAWVPGLKTKHIANIAGLRQLGIMEGQPWLAAIPDSMAVDPAAGKGVVEVNRPHLCGNQGLAAAADTSSAVCLSLVDGGSLSLKPSHSY